MIGQAVMIISSSAEKLNRHGRKTRILPTLKWSDVKRTDVYRKKRIDNFSPDGFNSQYTSAHIKGGVRADRLTAAAGGGEGTSADREQSLLK